MVMSTSSPRRDDSLRRWLIDSISDKDAYRALVRAYNTFLAKDYCSVAPDRLIGNAGNNMITGGKGDDRIDGGAGTDYAGQPLGPLRRRRLDYDFVVAAAA